MTAWWSFDDKKRAASPPLLPPDENQKLFAYTSLSVEKHTGKRRARRS